MNIIWKKSPNYAAGRNSKKVIAIVNHQTAGRGAGALSWLCNPKSQSSAHYLVMRDGTVYQLVKDSDTAYHAGIVNKPTWKLYNGTNPNRYTIGIEHECYPEVGGDGDLTEVQYQATLELHRLLIKAHGIPVDRDHIIGHYQIDSVNRPGCPGSAFPWERLLADLKGEIEVAQWKLDIITKAKSMGLITDDHNPDDPATKWFVLQVAMKAIAIIRGTK